MTTSPRSRAATVVGGAALALALVVGGALTGRALAGERADGPSPATAPAEGSAGAAPRTTAQVVAPVAVGVVELPEADQVAPPVGEVVGVAEVADPAEVVELPAAGDDGSVPEALVAELSAPGALPPGTPSDDELVALVGGGGVGGDPAPEGDGDGEGGEAAPADDGGAPPGVVPLVDPCAPVGSAPPEGSGCPDGVRTTVLAGVGAPELTVIALPDPRPLEAWPAGRTPFLHCPAVEVPAGAVRFGVAATAPGTATIVLTPLGEGGLPDRASARTVELTTTPEQLAAWEADLADDGRVLPVDQPMLCTNLELAGAGRWTYAVSYVDVFERRAAAPGGYLTRPDRRTTPEPTVLPLGTGQVWVSAPHRRSERVELAAYQEEGAAGSCESPDPRRQLLLPATPQATAEVAEDWLDDRGYDPSFDRATHARFGVPPGASVLVCIRSAGADDPASFGPRSVRVIRLRAPGAALPEVRLTRVGLARAASAGDVEVRVLWGRGRGLGCGGWSGPEVDGREVRLPEGGALLCGGGPSLDWSRVGPVVDQPLVVRTTVRRGDVTHTQSTVLGGVRARPCGSSGCTPTPEQLFEVPLPTAPQPSGLCGSSFGPCDPPSSERSLGTAQVRVRWSAEGTGGPGTWSIGPVEAERLPRPDHPVLDRWAEPEVASAGTADPDVLVRLTADRPADWSVRLLPAGCDRPGASVVLTARGTNRLSGTFPDVCPGRTYVAEARLTDPATGATASWSVGDGAPGPTSWPVGWVHVPGERVRLAVELVAATPPGGSLWTPEAERTALAPSLGFVRWARHPMRPAYTTDWDCGRQVEGTSVIGWRWSVITEVEVVDELELSSSVRLHPAEGSETRCNPAWGSVVEPVESSLRATVEGEALLDPEGVRVTSEPGAPFALALAARIAR